MTSFPIFLKKKNLTLQRCFLQWDRFILLSAYCTRVWKCAFNLFTQLNETHTEQIQIFRSQLIRVKPFKDFRTTHYRLRIQTEQLEKYFTSAPANCKEQCIIRIIKGFLLRKLLWLEGQTWLLPPITLAHYGSIQWMTFLVFYRCQQMSTTPIHLLGPTWYRKRPCKDGEQSFAGFLQTYGDMYGTSLKPSSLTTFHCMFHF